MIFETPGLKNHLSARERYPQLYWAGGWAYNYPK